MRLEQLRDRLAALGAKPCHARHVLRAWMQSLPLDSGPRAAADFHPLTLRTALPASRRSSALSRACARGMPAADGAERLLVELADGRDRRVGAVAARGAVRVDAGRLRRRLHVLHDRTRRAAAPRRQRGNRRAGRARALAARRPEGRVHGHGRTGPQPRQRARSDRAPRHRRRDRAQEPRLLDGRRPARVRAAAAGDREARARDLAAFDVRRAARGAAAARAAHRPCRTRGRRRALRARDALPDPVSMDAARRHQRRRRRVRPHRRAAGGQVRGDEPHPVQRRAGLAFRRPSPARAPRSRCG